MTEDLRRIVNLAGLQAVIELAEHLVEQMPDRRRVTVVMLTTLTSMLLSCTTLSEPRGVACLTDHDR
ncbi:hypothetical protein ACWDYH_38845 [Nocardia goodfellowii]